MTTPENLPASRRDLGFANLASGTFSFLQDVGFSKVRSLPTLVSYAKDGMTANVFHGRRSFEIGFEIVSHGTRYSLSEFIRLVDPAEGDTYRNTVATTVDAVKLGLARLKDLVERYVVVQLSTGVDPLLQIDRQRERWRNELALKTLVSAVKPKADYAFRQGDYKLASEMYDLIRAGLKPSELKKADFANKRAVRDREEGNG